MLDSPRLELAVRRGPLVVEDLRSTTVVEDPVQRRDLILLERARDGEVDAFNDLVVCYQDQLFGLIVRKSPACWSPGGPGMLDRGQVVRPVDGMGRIVHWVARSSTLDGRAMATRLRCAPGPKWRNGRRGGLKHR